MHRLEHDPLLADLNPPQREAVQHIDGPLLVLAGPGSGKTRVITRRAAYLVCSGIPASRVLCITFTNKAADEMRQRIAALGVEGGMWIYTFHALGARLLREFGDQAGIGREFTIYDEDDALRLLKQAFARCGAPQPRADELRRVRWIISHAKNNLEPPEALDTFLDVRDHRFAQAVYETYEKLLRANQAVDFDDLLMRVALLLRDDAELRERLNRRFRYLLIDEYQDTNHAQYLIARYLSQEHRNICATGDPDQSIYGWRGADISNILEFERDYPDARVVRLEQNYRSTGHILAAASRLIRYNTDRKHKDLWTEAGGGTPVCVWRLGDASDEAERVAETIQRLHEDESLAYNEMAILYRVNALSRTLEDALRRRRIPYRIVRGVAFYQRREVRDALAYLRVVANPADEVALLRIINTPPRGIGATTIQRLRDAASKAGLTLYETLKQVETVTGLTPRAKNSVRAFVELIEDLRRRAARERVDVLLAEAVRRSGLEDALRKESESEGEDRWANVSELITVAAEYAKTEPEPDLVDFLARTSLVSDQDAVDSEAGAVQLMTLHAAKGLEFDVVFLIGLEDGLLPHARVFESRDEMAIEEERRLCFVGMTRARKRLFITHAAARQWQGRDRVQQPSRFLDELAGEGVEVLDEAGEGFDEELAHELDGFVRSRRRSRSASFDPTEEPVISFDEPTGRFAGWGPGTLVVHDVYGMGRILELTPQGGRTRAVIRFQRAGRKVIFLESAPIQRAGRR